MKKTLLILLIALGLTSVSKASETPTVKLGELVEGKTIITFDKIKLHNALSYVLESEVLQIDQTEIFIEDGKYYLWALITDKATNLGKGKLIFSIEKTEKNDLVLAATPYVYQCLATGAGCSNCAVINSVCRCYIGDGVCEFKKIPIGSGTGRIGFGKAFDDLLKGQKVTVSE